MVTGLPGANASTAVEYIGCGPWKKGASIGTAALPVDDAASTRNRIIRPDRGPSASSAAEASGSTIRTASPAGGATCATCATCANFASSAPACADAAAMIHADQSILRMGAS